MKQRPFIPAPKLTPPDAQPGALPTVMQQADQAIATAEAQKPAPLAVVAAPKPLAAVELLPACIELRNCTIGRNEYFWIFPRTPRAQQVKEICPARAVIAHGVIVIEELNLILPIEGSTIRS